MSAIWGVIYRNGKRVSEEAKRSLVDRLSLYKVDSINTWEKGSIYLGCGLQYITQESLQEILPFYDRYKGLAITADAIIDNRSELFKQLKIPKEAQPCITDSELILLSYEKWGADCPRYLIGDFSFVIWDEKKDELFCVRDHVGKRTFYYYCDDNTFAFGTLIKPIFDLVGKKPDLNDKWIADFLVLKGPVLSVEYAESPYEGIYQLEPGHSLTVDKKGRTKRRYWDPLKEVKPLKLKSDEEYIEEFKKVFFEAVRCRLRSISDVGIMLSGGLDSGSIACVAAQELSGEGKRLRAFSSIPMEGYEFNDKKYRHFIPDEREYIRTIGEKYDNVDIEYCRNEGKDSVKDMDKYIDILEQPYKTIENSFWVFSMAEKAAKKGCRVLLSGQSGNTTISFGDFDVHIKTLFGKGKLIKMKREIDSLAKLYNLPKKRVIMEVIRVLLPYGLRKVVSNRVRKNIKDYEAFPVNPELVEKWNVKKRLEKKGYNLKPEKFYNLKDIHKYIVDNVSFSQVAIPETKASLAYGIVERDPSRDKRVIEFCLSLPSDQFVRNGVERRLIREAMKGILPEKIRSNCTKRGLQAADWIQRLKPSWQDICVDIERALENEHIKRYIDTSRLEKELELLKYGPDEDKGRWIKMLLIALVLSKFLEKHYSADTIRI